jgi:serine protease Do
MSNSTITTILLRHIDGAKSGQVDKFSASPDLEIRIGRGQTNQIAFDLSADSISREHCRIRVNPLLPDTYEITDLQSKNGTFVNGKAITEKTVLYANDVIRLGKDGPSMEFDLDPRPASHIKQTRVVDTPAAQTKVHDTSAKAVPIKEGIGKQTMQHIVKQSEKKSRKRLLITVVALLILVSTGGWIIYSNKPKKEYHETVIVKGDSTRRGLTPADIVKANEKKVVFIEVGWKLQLTSTGEQLYHVKLPMKERGVTQYYAAYIRNAAGAVEPYLCTKGNEPAGAMIQPIGGYGTGSGFVVDDRGYIATNRHVASPWLTSYHFSDADFPGVLLAYNQKGQLGTVDGVMVGPNDVRDWVPVEAGNYNRQNIESGVTVIAGDLSYLDVTFANNSLRTPGKVTRISNVHDVALVKIDMVEELTPVQLLNNYDEIESGSEVTVMGYPGMSPDQFVATRSQDAFNKNPNIVKVPVPTVSTGIIGRLVKGRAATDKVDGYMSVMGDYYQLTINSTGPGNSGGPMYDNKGNVIGIYSAGSDKMSYSIPIKYAMELMGRDEVIR